MAIGAVGAVARGLGRLFTSGGVAGLTEGQLLDRFVSRRDEAAFEALVARHGPMVLGVCRRLLRDPNDVDDAFQATFLVLVRRAGTLRRADRVGNWLYGVAYRVALRARAAAARREAAGDVAAALAGSREPSPPEAAAWKELFEEVHRLPERYRAPVVLCDLEGLTHEEAAARLGWPVGTVKGRLSRARERLRDRLTRRGLDPAAVVAASGPGSLGRHPLPFPLPPALVETTVTAAARVAAGNTTAAALGLVSARAAALAEGVIQAMTLTQMKSMVASVVLLGTVVTGAGVYAYQPGGPGRAEPRGDGAATAQPGAPERAEPKAAKAEPVRGLDDALFLLGGEEGRVFDRVLSETKDWTPHRVDRLAHFSRAILEAHEYLKDGRDHEARRAHLQRMEELHMRTQRLDVPGQDKIADAARVALDEASQHFNATETPTPPGGPITPKPAPNPAPVLPGAGMMGMMMGAGMMGRGMMGAPRPGSAGMMPGMAAEAAGPYGSTGEGRMRVVIAGLAPQVVAADRSPKTKAVWKKLDEPVSMNFEHATPLEDVIRYLKSATQGPKDPGIPVYVDPAGLQKAEITLTSPVKIDLEGVPLKTSLRLLLKQVGLAYCVKDGVLIVSTPEGVLQELQEAQSADESAPDDDQAAAQGDRPK